MDLQQKIRSLPTSPGIYLYKNAEGEVIYVGKAKNLRSRVSSYFHQGRWEDAKTGTLVREAVDVDYIVVANNREALALENHLIKQKKPRFNILLRDDKTYPYVKLTLAEQAAASVRDAPAAQGRERLLRALLSRQSRLSDCRSYSPALLHSILQGRSHAFPRTPLSAVLHQALPGTVRAKPDHARGIYGSRPRREAVPGRPADRPGEISA